MTKVTIDPATLAKLHNLDAKLEFCTPEGDVLGHFHPAHPAPRKRSPFSRAELERRRKQRSGQPVAEVLKRLEQA